jgi:hypothetical protein
MQRIVPYDRDVRNPDAPPVDGLAECVCLSACLYRPELIDSHDLGPLLTFPEHRELWRILRMTRARTRGDEANFLYEWYCDLWREHPDNWQNYEDLLTSAAERESWRAWQQYRADYGDHPYTTFLHDHTWWLARLVRIAEARRRISAAYKTIEHEWRVDERGTETGTVPIRVDV